MSQEVSFINGALLRLRREARGLSLNDMAGQACLSTRQIQQLEEGGMSAFYGEAVKITAAKKVGALLGLSANEVLVPPQPEQSQALEGPEDGMADNAAALVESEPIVEALVPVAPAVASIDVPSSGVATTQETKSKASLWLIAALLFSALGLAAYLQPKDEPAEEPAPPLQVVPADAEDAASEAQPPAVTAAPASHTP